MDPTAEERIEKLEREVGELRRKLEALEDTVSALYAELRSRDEALDVTR
jgi:hypothetical protein